MATLPFAEGFENATLASYWQSNSTNTGRIQVTVQNGPFAGAGHLTMDSAIQQSPSRNQLTLLIGLQGYREVELRLQHRFFSDEGDSMPASFFNASDSDGIAISADGTSWHKVQGLTPAEGVTSNYKAFVIDLDAATATAGIDYTQQFRIRFQQFDDLPIPTDGFSFDNVTITSTNIGTGTNIGAILPAIHLTARR